jgi:hypothetical protein
VLRIVSGRTKPTETMHKNGMILFRVLVETSNFASINSALAPTSTGNDVQKNTPAQNTMHRVGVFVIPLGRELPESTAATDALRYVTSKLTSETVPRYH